MLNGVFLHTAFMFQYCGLSYRKSINKEENWVFKCGSYRVLDITVTFKCLSGFCAHQKKGNQDEKLRFGFMWCINLEVGSGRVQKKGSCVIILVWFWAWNVLCLSLGRTVRTVCQPQRKASLSVCYWNASCWHCLFGELYPVIQKSLVSCDLNVRKINRNLIAWGEETALEAPVCENSAIDL